MSLRLGIDIGTSGVRSAVIDEAGAPISDARAAHLAQGPLTDARKWWQAVAQCLNAQIAALEEIGLSGADIHGIAVDGTSGSMVLTDDAMTPVSPALMYNSTGFREEAARIAEFAPENHITRGTNSALARAMRLTKDVNGPARHLLHQADFIANVLLGQGGLSDFNNTLKTGFEPEEEAWPGWIAEVIAPELLPDVRAMGDPFGKISPRISAQFAISPDALIFPGTTDSLAAFLAAAPLEVGVAVTSLGSTLATKIVSDARIDDPSVGLYSHRIGDVWLAGGASNTGGAVLAQFFSAEEIAELSGRIVPETPTDLDYYPLLKPGERFPINDPQLAPRMTPRPSDDARFLQGLFEGMAAIEARCYAAIRERGGAKLARLFTAGGGAKNEVWSRIRARALGFPISQAQETEAAVGVARLATQR